MDRRASFSTWLGTVDDLALLENAASQIPDQEDADSTQMAPDDVSLRVTVAGEEVRRIGPLEEVLSADFAHPLELTFRRRSNHGAVVVYLSQERLDVRVLGEAVWAEGILELLRSTMSKTCHPIEKVKAACVPFLFIATALLGGLLVVGLEAMIWDSIAGGVGLYEKGRLNSDVTNLLSIFRQPVLAISGLAGLVAGASFSGLVISYIWKTMSPRFQVVTSQKQVKKQIWLVRLLGLTVGIAIMIELLLVRAHSPLAV